MSFDKIGPYELTRGDLVAAAVTISFLIAGNTVRLAAMLYVLIGLALVISGLVTHTLLITALGVFFIIWIFIGAPALRSRKRSKQIYIEYNPEGIVGETPHTRTTYKWSTIGKAKRVGSRLFIMITDRVALVIPDRSTSHENMNRLIATLSQERVTTDL